MSDLYQFAEATRKRYKKEVYLKNKHKKIDHSTAIKQVKKALDLLVDIEGKENHLYCYEGVLPEKICDIISLLVFNVLEEEILKKLDEQLN